MVGYALNDQMSYENDLIGIFVLIPILKNCFLRIVINTAINLQCVFVVLGKSNYNVANFSSAVRYCWSPQMRRRVPIFVIRNLQAQTLPTD